MAVRHIETLYSGGFVFLAEIDHDGLICNSKLHCLIEHVTGADVTLNGDPPRPKLEIDRQIPTLRPSWATGI